MPASKSTSVSAEAVREFLRQSSELPQWTTSYAQKILSADAKTTREALQALETSGYIERVAKSNTEWRNTASGNAAVRVSAAKPIKRATAEDKLDELLERVDQLNKDPKYLFRVERVVLFGPYLAKTANIKDIDIAVELKPKERDPARHTKLMAQRAEEAEAAGKKFKNHLARAENGRTEVLDYLKARSRTIALRELDDWVLNQPHKQIR